jgi:hypothetical protein
VCTIFDKVFVSDDGHRAAVYSYKSSVAPTTGATMEMDMGMGMGKSAVTFYDRRVTVVENNGSDSDSEESITWVQVARLGHNDTGPVVAGRRYNDCLGLSCTIQL